MSSRRKKMQIGAAVLAAAAIVTLLGFSMMRGRDRLQQRQQEIATAQKKEESRESWLGMIETADESLAKEQKSSSRARLFAQKAYAHAQLKEWEAMHENFRLGRDADAKMLAGSSHLAWTATVLAENEKYDEAVVLYEETLTSERPGKGIEYARFLATTKRDEKRAIALFRAYLKTEEDAYSINADLSKALSNTDQFEEALTQAKLAREGAFRHYDEMQTRARASLEAGVKRGAPSKMDQLNVDQLAERRPKMEAQWNTFVKDCEERKKPGYSQKY
jgi:hypothetical protein